MHDALACAWPSAARISTATAARDLGGERAAIAEHLAERVAANQFDDEVLLALVLVRDVEDLDDVRVAELRDRLRLGVKARLRFDRVAEVRVDDLHRDLARETRVVRAVHGGHSAVPDLLDDLVLGELGQPSARVGRGRHRLRFYRGPRGAPRASRNFRFQLFSPSRFNRLRSVLSLSESERAARDWLPSARASTCVRICRSSSSNVVPVWGATA